MMRRAAAGALADAVLMPAARARRRRARGGCVRGRLRRALRPRDRAPLAAGALLALALAILLNAGVAAYSGAYLGWIMPVALWITLPLLIFAGLRRLYSATRFVLGFSAAALFLKILALVHPSKELIDALFHAHRFQEVLGSRSPLPQRFAFGRRNLPALAALFGAASLGFLSHVGIFPILAVTLVATGALYWLLGARELRPTSGRAR